MVGSQKGINVRLDSYVELDEIIVNAYGASTTCTVTTGCGFNCVSITCVEDILKEPSTLAGFREINLFPNPSSNGLFQLKLKEVYHNVKLSVATINGQIVQSFSFNKINGNFHFDLSQLPSGIYFVNIIADGKRLKPQKAILN